MLRNPSCGARNCFAAWSAAQFRPLRQPLLPLSATGGGRKRCPTRSACLVFKIIYTNKKIETDTLRHPFLFLAGAEGLDRKCFAFSLRSATEILANFSTRLTLFAKNSPPDCFLTLRPSRVQVLQTSNRNQKEPQTATLPDFGRGRRT